MNDTLQDKVARELDAAFAHRVMTLGKMNEWHELCLNTAATILGLVEVREAAMRKALKDAWERMDRARSILRDSVYGGRSEDNWGMLDTTVDRTALAGAKE